MLTEEQVIAIKKQLTEHVEKSFPEDKKQFAKQQIHNMDEEDLEKFLASNNLISGQDNKCIFCSIVFGDIPSYNLDENQDAIAVLEINPISRGHSLIIPKKHLKEGSEMPSDAENLAKEIEKRIKSKLKPKRIDTIISSLFGHQIINILPVYADETMSAKRRPAKKEDLEEVEKLLKQKPKSEIAKTKTPKPKKSMLKEIAEKVAKFEKKLWLPQRIP